MLMKSKALGIVVIVSINGWGALCCSAKPEPPMGHMAILGKKYLRQIYRSQSDQVTLIRRRVYLLPSTFASIISRPKNYIAIGSLAYRTRVTKRSRRAGEEASRSELTKPRYA